MKGENMKSLALGIAVAVGSICSLAYQASATIPFFQGFEVDTSDWTYYLAMNRVQNGGGLLGLTAAHGSYYAEIQNLDGAYGGSLGDAGHTYFGTPVSTYTGNFYTAIALYVDAAHWGPVGQGFWFDQSPRGTNGATAFEDESGFYFSVPSAGTVRVNTGGGFLANITRSGW